MNTPRDMRKSNVVPLVRAAMIGPVVKAFAAAGGDVGGLLAPHGLSAGALKNSEVFITNDTVYAVFNEISEKTKPDFCARVGQNLDTTMFKTIAPKLVDAVTLGDVLTTFSVAVARETNAASMSVLVEGIHTYFTAKRKFNPSVSPAQVDAFQVAMWISLLHRVMDFRWDPALVVVRVNNPAAIPREFHGIKPIACDSSGFSFRLPSDWLGQKLNFEDLVSPAAPAESTESAAPADLITSVKDVIRSRLTDPNFGVNEAAKACGFKTDTLNRKLRPHATTVSALLADTRCEEAKAALTTGTESIAEIAQNLGYSDATAFSRAFKKWTGRTPTKFKTRNSEWA